MTRPANPAPVDLDDIVARVLAEASRRTNAEAVRGAPRLAWKDIEGRLGAPLAHAAPPPAPASAFATTPDRRYALGDFLPLHGADFVHAAYRALLGREPDAAGLAHNVARLAAGADKAELLARIRFSAEGRAYGAAVGGLLPRAVVAGLARVPVAGYLVDWLVSLAALPRTRRALRAIEARLAERGPPPA